MEADLEDLNFMQAMQSMFNMAEDAIEDLIQRLDSTDMTELTDALVNQDKPRAEQIVASADGEKKVNPLFRGDMGELPKQKKRVRKVNDDYQYKYGDDVQVEMTDPATGKVSYEDGTVYLPDGPEGTIGVKVQGKARMVKRNKLNKLEEGVIGMTGVPELARMQQLAGLQPAGTGIAPPSPEIAVDSDVTADPCTAAQQAMQALDMVQTMLPNIRLADLKQIRQRILGLQTQMNEGVLRPRKM